MLPGFFSLSFPCSADRERYWPPCKVVFFGLATNTLHVRNNKNYMERFCLCSLRSHLNVLICFPSLTGGCSEGLDAFIISLNKGFQSWRFCTPERDVLEYRALRLRHHIETAPISNRWVFTSNHNPRPTRPISLTKPTHRVLRPSAKIGTTRSARLALAILVWLALGYGLTTRSAGVGGSGLVLAIDRVRSGLPWVVV